MTGAAERLETPRLILRMFREDDFEAYYAKIGSDPDVMRYLGEGRTFTRSEARSSAIRMASIQSCT